MVSDVDCSGEQGCEGVELDLEAGVVGAGTVALDQVPDRVPPELPGFVDFWGLGGLDWSGGEVVLTGGDLNPNVDGGDLAFPVPGLGSLRAGDRRKPGDQVRPCVFVDGPGFQGLAPLLIVDQMCGGSSSSAARAGASRVWLRLSFAADRLSAL
jgi:hypothetical protein